MDGDRLVPGPQDKAPRAGPYLNVPSGLSFHHSYLASDMLPEVLASLVAARHLSVVKVSIGIFGPAL